MFRFDLQAISVNVHDANAFADGCGAATGRPFAVAEADAPSMGIDRLRDDHDPPEEAPFRVVQLGARAVIVTRRVEAASADANGKQR